MKMQNVKIPLFSFYLKNILKTSNQSKALLQALTRYWFFVILNLYFSCAFLLHLFTIVDTKFFEFFAEL